MRNKSSTPAERVRSKLNREGYIAPGFPKTLMFKNWAQINAYFAGSEVVCLLCGLHYKSLACHLRWRHEITPREYKAEYGLPYDRGLLCEDLYNHRSEMELERIANGTTALYNPEMSKEGTKALLEMAARGELRGTKRQPFALTGRG